MRAIAHRYRPVRHVRPEPGVGLINMNVLYGLGDDISLALANLQTQSNGALRGFRSDFPLAAERAAVIAVMQRIQDTLDWAPRNLVSIASTMMDTYQTFPLISSYTTLGLPSSNRPAWLQDTDNLAAWQKVYDAYKPLVKAFTDKQMGVLQAEGAKLDANADFWNALAKYSGVAKLEELWNKFWDSVTALKAVRASTKTGIDTVNDIIAKYGTKVPSQYVATNNTVRSQFDVLTAKAKSLLMPIPTAASEAGLGALPLIIAGVAAATLVAITAGVWATVNEFTSIQRQANGNAQDVIKWRDTQDAADYAAGKINNEELMARRQQSVDAAKQIVQNQGAAQVGLALKDAGAGLGTSIGVSLGVVGILAIGGYFLVKKFG